MQTDRRSVLRLVLSVGGIAAAGGIGGQVLRDLGLSPVSGAEAQTVDLAADDRMLRRRLLQDREFLAAAERAGHDPRALLERARGAFTMEEMRAEQIRHDSARGIVLVIVERRELPAPPGIYLFPDGRILEVGREGRARPLLQSARMTEASPWCMCVNPPEGCAPGLCD